MLRAWFGGLWRVLCAPVLVIAVYAMTLAITAPLGAVLHRSLPEQGTRLVPTTEDPVPADPDWLDEVSSEGRGLLPLLSPAIFGVAAPLSNLSAIVDATGWPLPVLGVVAVYWLTWMAIWGGVIARLASRRSPGPRALFDAARRSAPRVLALGVAGLAAYFILFLVLRAPLMGPLYNALASGAQERTAVGWWAALAAVFVVALASLAQVLDFARLSVVLDGLDVRPALARGLADVRRHLWSVVGLVVLTTVLFAALLAAYGAVEFIPGGSIPTLPRLIAIGQAYIVARLVLRLTLTAAQIRLRNGDASN